MRKIFTVKGLLILFVCFAGSYLLIKGPYLHDLSWQTHNNIIIDLTEIIAILFYIAGVFTMIILSPINLLLGEYGDRIICNVQSVPCLIPIPLIIFFLVFLSSSTILISLFCKRE